MTQTQTMLCEQRSLELRNLRADGIQNFGAAADRNHLSPGTYPPKHLALLSDGNSEVGHLRSLPGTIPPSKSAGTCFRNIALVTSTAKAAAKDSPTSQPQKVSSFGRSFPQYRLNLHRLPAAKIEGSFVRKTPSTTTRLSKMIDS